MASAITTRKVVLIVFAVLGALFVLGAVSMATMHSLMMGSASSHGIWASMVGMCRSMMGS